MVGQQSNHTLRSRRLLATLGVVLVLSESLAASQAWACGENAMIVFDASGSMARHRGGQSKINIARRAAADVLPDITKHRQTGLVTYGGIGGPACRDVVVRVALEANSGRRIVSELENIPPLGPTALTDSVRVATDILRQRNAPGVVVLITDGLENCGGKACAFARELRDRGDQIRVHVISFFLEGTKMGTLKCLTEATGGTYVTANSLQSLREALRKLLGCQRVSKLGNATK